MHMLFCLVLYNDFRILIETNRVEVKPYVNEETVSNRFQIFRGWLVLRIELLRQRLIEILVSLCMTFIS
jgi:hypothetical protein